MSAKVLIVMANGFEEVEAMSSIDVLRRAGLEVIVAGVGNRNIVGAHNVRIETDMQLDEFEGIPDAIVLPGGMPGAENLKNSKKLCELLQTMHQEKRCIAAICASPAVVLAQLGILKDKEATCYPGFEKQFDDNTRFVTKRVVVDGHIITSRGPGTALEFALAIVYKLVGSEMTSDLVSGMLVKQ